MTFTPDGDAEPFGRRVDAGTVEEDLATIRTARDRYRIEHPAETRAIRELVDRLRGR